MSTSSSRTAMCKDGFKGGRRARTTVRGHHSVSAFAEATASGHDSARGMTPGGAMTRLPAKRSELVERPNERVLREIAGERVVSRHPEGEPVDTIHVAVVQLPPRLRVARPNRCHEFCVIHVRWRSLEPVPCALRRQRLPQKGCVG